MEAKGSVARSFVARLPVCLENHHLFLFFLMWPRPGLRKFWGQGSNWRQSSDPSRSTDNAGSLTRCATPPPPLRFCDFLLQFLLLSRVFKLWFSGASGPTWSSKSGHGSRQDPARRARGCPGVSRPSPLPSPPDLILPEGPALGCGSLALSPDPLQKRIESQVFSPSLSLFGSHPQHFKSPGVCHF